MNGEAFALSTFLFFFSLFFFQTFFFTLSTFPLSSCVHFISNISNKFVGEKLKQTSDHVLSCVGTITNTQANIYQKKKTPPSKTTKQRETSLGSSFQPFFPPFPLFCAHESEVNDLPCGFTLWLHRCKLMVKPQVTPHGKTRHLLHCRADVYVRESYPSFISTFVLCPIPPFPSPPAPLSTPLVVNKTQISLAGNQCKSFYKK